MVSPAYDDEVELVFVEGQNQQIEPETEEYTFKIEVKNDKNVKIKITGITFYFFKDKGELLKEIKGTVGGGAFEAESKKTSPQKEVKVKIPKTMIKKIMSIQAEIIFEEENVEPPKRTIRQWLSGKIGGN